MAEDTKTPWLNHMAILTVIFAVGATLSTFKGGGYSTQSVINQTLASDQWAFYQAKAIKEHLYELQEEQMQLQAMAFPANSPVAKAYAKAISDFQVKAKQYEAEKIQIQAKARDLESQRDMAKRRGKPFGIAVIFLQVAILLNSIAGLMKMKRIWWVAIPVGLTGLIFFADGFFVLF